MTNLNLDANNVTEIELSVMVVRALLDGDVSDKLELALDNAQGEAKQGKGPQYIVIKVSI